MLELDIATLLTTAVVILTVLSGLLAVIWVQNRSVPAIGIWSISFALCAGAGALWGARGVVPAFVAIELANAMRLLAFGLGWWAARNLAGGKESWVLAFAPAILWLALAPLLPNGDAPRIVVSSFLIGAYALAMAAELVQAARSGMRMAIPAAVMLGIHGVSFIARAIALLVLGEPIMALDAGSGAAVNPLVVFEALIVALALAFLFVSAAKEKIEIRHRATAHIDPLTGIANRRGFDAAAAGMLARAARDGSPTAFLLLDLDHFKAVNDTFGHKIGDFVLQAVARAIEDVLRDGDVAARLGGEEFAVALAGSRTDQAAVVAERLRRAVATLDIRCGERPIDLTVSIGVAALRDAPSLDALFSRADKALYRAKAEGRNRVEFASAPLTPADRVARMVAEQRAA